MPEELEVAVGDDSVPPTPPEKLTWIPGTPVPAAFLTLTFKGRSSGDATGAFCEFPEEIDNAVGPLRVAVAEKFAVAYPVLVAVMVYVPAVAGRV